MLRRVASAPWLRSLRPRRNPLCGRLSSTAVEELNPSPLQLQLAAAASLVGLGGLTYLVGNGLKFTQERESEAAWLGARGPLGSERSIAYLPTGMCVASGCLAAVLQKLYPKHIIHLALHHGMHEMLALPMSLLIAFRFQGAYERWWSSRMKVSDLVGRCVAIAEYVAHNIPQKLEGDEDPQKVEAVKEAIEVRRRFLKIIEAYLVFVEEKIHGADFAPHPENEVAHWRSGYEILKELSIEEAEVCQGSGQEIVWCSSAMLACICKFQDLEVLDGDNGSMVSSSIMGLEQVFIECMVVRVQGTPAPFIAHHRTIMTIFCVTLPFAIINKVGWLLMVPVQTVISFAFLGSEYVSREMDHPFGNDKSSIPVRKIVHGACERIRYTGGLDF